MKKYSIINNFRNIKNIDFQNIESTLTLKIITNFGNKTLKPVINRWSANSQHNINKNIWRQTCDKNFLMEFQVRYLALFVLFRCGTHLYMSLFLSVHLSISLCICRAPYLRNHTSSNYNLWCTSVKWWYL